LDRATDYRAFHGYEHCPRCYVERGMRVRLRLEPHHNSPDAVMLHCDWCGFALVI
jgi:hypothetical protein